MQNISHRKKFMQKRISVNLPAKSMDFIKQLKAETSRRNIDLVVQAVMEHPEEFDNLYQLIYSDISRIPNLAAWALEKCVAQNPAFLTSYIHEVIDFLPQIRYSGLRRSLLKSLTFCDIPEERLGELLDICLDWLQDPKIKTAVKIYSMHILLDIARKEPDIRFELIPVIESQLDHNTVGFNNRGKKTIKALHQLDCPDTV